MNSPITKHPTVDQLRRFGSGQLEPEESAAVEEHIAGCDTCCESLAAMGDDTLLANLKNCETSIPETIDSARLTARKDTASQSGIPVELVNHPRYRVVKELGKGGMGVVYKAEHRLMERPVALKVINHKLVENATAVERFRLEVRAAAKLSHTNIVTAHDAEQAGSIHFLVMEYVEGIDLAKQVHKAGPLPVRHACHFVRQVAMGLQHASTKGMVHRDIKPQNLMLTREGRVKILDFGLARLASEVDVDSEAAKLTKDGVMLGTPDYMAPEQILDSRQADIRADIYSLGCTLYFLLTGHAPFPKGSAVDKMTAHLKQTAPEISQDRTDVPQELVEVVTRMMAKRVEGRYQTPQEVVDALQPFCQVTPSPAQPKAPPTAPAPTPPTPEVDPLSMILPGVAPMPAALYSNQAARTSNAFAKHQRKFIAGAIAMALLLLCAIAAGPIKRTFLVKGSDTTSTSSGSPIVEAPTTSDEGAAGESAPVTDRPRIAIVVPRNGLYWPDYGEVATAFGDGAEIIVASSRTGRIVDHENRRHVVARHTLDQLDATQLDAIIFTGADQPGRNLEFLRQGDYFEQTHSTIEAMIQNGKCVTAICVGSAVLEHHGVLKGKRATWTTYMPDNDQSLFPDAVWVKQHGVIHEDNVITATSFQQAEEFVDAILAAVAD